MYLGFLKRCFFSLIIISTFFISNAYSQFYEEEFGRHDPFSGFDDGNYFPVRDILDDLETEGFDLDDGEEEEEVVEGDEDGEIIDGEFDGDEAVGFEYSSYPLVNFPSILTLDQNVGSTPLVFGSPQTLPSNQLYVFYFPNNTINDLTVETTISLATRQMFSLLAMPKLNNILMNVGEGVVIEASPFEVDLPPVGIMEYKPSIFQRMDAFLIEKIGDPLYETGIGQFVVENPGKTLAIVGVVVIGAYAAPVVIAWVAGGSAAAGATGGGLALGTTVLSAEGAASVAALGLGIATYSQMDNSGATPFRCSPEGVNCFDPTQSVLIRTDCRNVANPSQNSSGAVCTPVLLKKD